MKNPQTRRKFTVVDLILILLLIIMVVSLYHVAGGNLLGLIHVDELSSGSSPLSVITRSLSAFGEGIKNMFAGFLR